jgi:hypothetical protein
MTKKSLRMFSQAPANIIRKLSFIVGLHPGTQFLHRTGEGLHK